MAKQNETGSAKRTRGKTDPLYWKARLFRPAYTRSGRRIELQTWAVRIRHAGRRETFNLNANNRTEACEAARDRFLFLKANGWEATLAKFKPRLEVKSEAATVGAVIQAASRVATVKPRSLAIYCNALRHLAAGVAGLKAGEIERKTRRREDGKPGNPKLAKVRVRTVVQHKPARSAYRSSEFKAWRARIDALPLSTITAARVAKWRAERIAAKVDPPERASAKVSADSVIRSAKALFGRKILPHIVNELNLPAPLPLAGVSVGKSTKRFRADVSAPWLYGAARAELENAKPEVWKAFVLCLLGGLRRAEADCLAWAQLNLEAGRIEIRRTPHFAPKSNESERDVELAPEAVEMMRRFRAIPKPDPVFVLQGGPARPASRFEYYRASAAPHRTWRGLAEWLRGKGVTAKMPVQALRKMAGSMIHERFGIEAARDFLGHADIATTSASYVDRRPRVTVSFASVPSILSPGPSAGPEQAPEIAG